MNLWVLLAFLSLSTTTFASPTSQDGRITALEKRVDALESAFDGLGPKFAARYNLKAACMTPEVQNGKAICEHKKCRKGHCVTMKTGERCYAICNPGFVPSPGKEKTYCKDDGSFTVELQCEIPLLMISGGNVGSNDETDSTVELVSLYPSHGCDANVTSMPEKNQQGRRFHNLLYVDQKKTLACNGFMSESLATCDSWNSKDNTWRGNGGPNRGYPDDERVCDGASGSRYFDYSKKCPPMRNKGRYGAQAVQVAGYSVILGGMLYDEGGQKPTDNVRKQIPHLTYWMPRDNMKKKRSFFCSLNVNDRGILSIGGLSKGSKGNIIEKSVEFEKVDRSVSRGDYYEEIPLKIHSQFSDMVNPRSGHGCTMLPGDDLRVLVAGGTKAFGEDNTPDAEIYNWSKNEWANSASMWKKRFGHALVTVGSKVFAVGGGLTSDERLDSIEEYDVRTDSWKLIETKLKKPRADFGFTLVPHSLFHGCVIENPLTE